MYILLTINNETTRYLSFPTKRKLTHRDSRFRSKIGTSSGTCRVVYAPGYWNEFDFKGHQDCIDKILPCLDEELIDEFKR